MKLFKITEWKDGTGHIKHIVSYNDSDELDIRRKLSELVLSNDIDRFDMVEIDLADVNDITQLTGLSFVELRSLILWSGNIKTKREYKY